MTMKGKSILERFLKKVNKTETCWIWTSSLSGNGYGTFCTYDHGNRKKPKHHVASRLSWELFRGPIPEGFLVCHHCDNRLCVNPEHLFLGSYKDNTQDMFNKKRGYQLPALRGEDSPRAKLTMEQANEIRNLYKSNMKLTYRQLGHMFSVSHNAIARIIKNRGYKNP